MHDSSRTQKTCRWHQRIKTTVYQEPISASIHKGSGPCRDDRFTRPGPSVKSVVQPLDRLLFMFVRVGMAGLQAAAVEALESGDVLP